MRRGLEGSAGVEAAVDEPAVVGEVEPLAGAATDAEALLLLFKLAFADSDWLPAAALGLFAALLTCSCVFLDVTSCFTIDIVDPTASAFASFSFFSKA